MIGGIAENFGSSFALGGGEHFILEGDEYDTAFFDKGPKFLHYFPDAVVLTSVEFDHADIYKDLDAVETSFKRLVNLVPRRGRIVAFDTGASVERCVAKAFCPVERYGLQRKVRVADRRLCALSRRELRGLCCTMASAGPTSNFSLAGEYNVCNATAAAAMASGCGIPSARIQHALRTFSSVKRRLEVKAQVNGITIIDDFAHHPTAIAGTLDGTALALSGIALVGDPRTALEHTAPERLSARARQQPRTWPMRS